MQSVCQDPLRSPAFRGLYPGVKINKDGGISIGVETDGKRF
ncbi:MAG TPA: hypothetical protein VI704_08625 [Bacteroidota bacterium]|nr:hypothetical protein [Bacteroidota bacterium]